MISHRIVPVLMFIAVVTCFVLMGVPWGESPPYGNFSGQAVYNAEKGRLELTGNYSLYGCETAPTAVHLRVLVGDRARDIEINPSDSSFTGQLEIPAEGDGAVQAELVVDGLTVARGRLDLPAAAAPGVHILRFASQS